MRTALLTLLLSFGAAFAVAQDKPADSPLTQEDIHGAIQDATSQMKGEIRRLERSVAAQTQKQREALQRQQEALHAQQLAEQEKMRADIARVTEVERKRMIEDAEHARRNLRITYGIAGILILIGVGIVVLAARPRTKTVVVRGTHSHSVENEPLIDPEIPDLKKMARITGRDTVPFYLKLQEGRKPLCVAQLIEGQNPLIVSVDNVETKISWADRKRKVATELSHREKRAS